jgi:hypothetical protein
MRYSRPIRNASHATLIVLIFTASAMAEWKAANSEVAAAAKESKIASVLEAVNAIDAALIKTLWSTTRRIVSRSGGQQGEEILQG